MAAESYSQYGGVPMGFDSSTGASMSTYSVGGNSYYAYNPDSSAYAPGMSYNEQLGIHGYSNKQNQFNSSLVNAASNLALGLINYGSTASTNKQNKEMQEKAWELNSLTHRVKEALSLGLNKQLMTGQTPNYTLSTSMQAPQLRADPVGKALDTLMALENLDYLQLQKTNMAVQSGLAYENMRKMKHDNDIYDTRKNLAHDDPMLYKMIYGGRDILGLPKDVNNVWELLEYLFGSNKHKETSPTPMMDRGDYLRDASAEHGSDVFEDAYGVMHFLDRKTGEYWHYSDNGHKIYDGVYAPGY